MKFHYTLKKLTGCLSLSVAMLVWFMPAHSALPPQFQNSLDLDTMVSFVKKHPTVLQGIEQIDVAQQKVIYFSSNETGRKRCVITFVRKSHLKKDADGPVGKFMFGSSTCDIAEVQP